MEMEVEVETLEAEMEVEVVLKSALETSNPCQGRNQARLGQIALQELWRRGTLLHEKSLSTYMREALLREGSEGNILELFSFGWR